MPEQGGTRERSRHGESEAPEISAMAGADEDGVSRRSKTHATFPERHVRTRPFCVVHTVALS